MDKGYYAIIPAGVRYDNNLKANEKLLYGEITALCNEKGFCWAENGYFAKLYNVATTTISRWISNLEKNGYLKRELIYENGTKEIKERRIYILDPNMGCLNNQDPIDEKSKTLPTKKSIPFPQKEQDPIDEKSKDNNTSNNTFNNTTNKEKEKKETLVSIIENYTENINLRGVLLDFIEYRRSGKNKFTKQALKLNLTTLTKLGKTDEEKIRIVEQCIERSWSGFYPLASNKNMDTKQNLGSEWDFLNEKLEL